VQHSLSGIALGGDGRIAAQRQCGSALTALRFGRFPTTAPTPFRAPRPHPRSSLTFLWVSAMEHVDMKVAKGAAEEQGDARESGFEGG